MALVLALSPAVGSAGDDALGVALDIDECIATDAELVRRLLVIELGTSMPRGAPGDSTAAVTRVELSCAGELIEIRVHDPVTGKSLIRRISPGARKGRERLLALAAMELVVASWIELEATPQPLGQLPATPLAAEARRSAKRVVRRRLPASRWQTTTTLVGNTAWIGSLHAGLGVRVARDRRGPRGIGWTADITAQTSWQEVSLGTIATHSLSGSGTVHVQRDAGVFRLRAGLGGRVGAASITGKPNAMDSATGNQLTGFTAGPLVRLGAQLQAARGATVALALESGVHVLSMRGLVDGATESSLSGVWLGAQLGVGWTW